MTAPLNVLFLWRLCEKALCCLDRRDRDVRQRFGRLRAVFGSDVVLIHPQRAFPRATDSRYGLIALTSPGTPRIAITRIML
jgi:hypothetical protein